MILKTGVYSGNIDADMLLTTAAETTPATQETISTTLASSKTPGSTGNLTETITITHLCLVSQPGLRKQPKASYVLPVFLICQTNYLNI